MALIQKAFSDIITFSRSSNATRVGPTGLVEYAPHNLLQRSQEFDNAYWTKTGATITANALAAPDGTVTADTQVSTVSGGSQSYISVNVGTLTNGQAYTVSRYVKAGSKAFCTIGLFGLADAYFDLNNLTYSFSGTGAVSASITSVGNGWCRVTATWTWGSGTTYTLFFAMASSLSSQTGLSVGDYIYTWGAQLSVGPYPLDYTPTTSAAVYGPRFDYDPVTLAARGLLVEEQRTNLITYSEQFNNAAWSLYNLSVTANSAVSPDGTTNADTLTTSSAGSAYQVSIGSAGQTLSISCYAKAGTSSAFNLDIASGGNGRTAAFNLSAGTTSGVSNQGAGTYATGGTASIQSVGNGWYRCSMDGVSITGAVNPGFVNLANGSLYVWGAQVEVGAFSTSYVPTLASTVTRSADVASVNTLSPWFNATEGTFLIEAGKDYGNDTGTRRLLVSDGTGPYFFYANSVGVSTFTLGFQAGDTTQFSMTATANVGAVFKAAAAFKANDGALSVNGAAAVTDSTGQMPTGDTKFEIGSSTGSPNLWNGHIRRIAYFPRRLQNAEIVALTA